jgi:O-antigen/teichoic acid export membrane protein
LDVRLSKRLLGYGGKAWIGNIIQYFNYRLDVYFVNFFWGASAVGFYSIAVSLAELLWYIPHAVATVLFPKTAADWEQAKDFTPRVSRNIAAITAVAAAMLAIGAPGLLTIAYGERFRPAVAPLLALLPGVVFLSVGKIVSSDLAGRNRPQFGMWAALTSLGLTLVLDVILIPPLGTTGAGLASSVAYAVTTIILVAWYVRMSGNGPVCVLVMQRTDLQMYWVLASRLYRRVRGEDPA